MKTGYEYILTSTIIVGWTYLERQSVNLNVYTNHGFLTSSNPQKEGQVEF